jgi:hypothetical protein
VSTDTYIGRPGMTKPSWLRGQTLVVERFTGGPGRAGGTLAFVAERTTFVPPGSVVTEQAPAPGRAGTYRYTGEYALAGVPSGPVPPAGGLPELSPGRTLVTPDIGPLCIATTTPVAGGAVITATRMGLQDAFLAGRFAPLRNVPAPANGGQKSAAARESSVGASLRVLERRSSSGTRGRRLQAVARRRERGHREEEELTNSMVMATNDENGDEDADGGHGDDGADDDDDSGDHGVVMVRMMMAVMVVMMRVVRMMMMMTMTITIAEFRYVLHLFLLPPIVEFVKLSILSLQNADYKDYFQHIYHTTNLP